MNMVEKLTKAKKQFEGKQVGVGQIRIDYMLDDVIRYIEELERKAELADAVEMKKYNKNKLPKALITHKFNHLEYPVQGERGVWVAKENIVADVQIWYITKGKIRCKYTDEYGSHNLDTTDFEFVE